MADRNKYGRFIKGWKGNEFTDEEKERISSGLRKYYSIHPPSSGVFKKGHTPWIKGKHRSEETKRKISEKLRGKKLSKEHIENIKKGIKRGEKHHAWKGGYFYDGGYKLIYSPNHPYAKICCVTKYVPEHRLVMEKHLRRYLKPDEIVHHINEIRDDNRIENLMLFENDAEHMKAHMTDKKLSNETRIKMRVARFGKRFKHITS